ncbi:MAG: DNA primase [Bacteroidia bacterium]|nr:DNA primase [Bacteroidia bacterium]
MIPKDTIDKIFDAARIEEIVGDYVTLKKRGANLLGLCPFHNEKTPSFTVSPAKGIYKCFGCGKAGNSVNFIMEHDQLSYPEALRFLAKKYNIEIEEKERTPEEILSQNEKESLYVVCTHAQKYFSNNLLTTDEGRSIGLSYFKERGFRDDIIEKFQLGYALDDRKAFTNDALKKGYKAEYLVKAGLTVNKEDAGGNAPSPISETHLFDRFSGRVIFPIHNLTGRIIAFGGRILKTDKKLAKYINSPETEIYHKSNVLYGIYFAKKSIISNDVCYLVEGYTDVISMHQAGIENVVASSGTSLTIEQIRLIKRYTQNITILYDGDNAGIKASFRGINMILEEGLNVKVLLFPDGDDPDSFAKRVSNDELKKFIESNTKDFIAFKTMLLYSEVSNDPIKKAQLVKDIVESIAIIPEAINRSVYIKECSRLMDMDEQLLLNELNKIRRKKTNEKNKKENALSEPSLIDEVNVEAPPQPLLPENSIEHQERGIIRLLLNYADKTILVDGNEKDDRGNPLQVNVTVAEIIIDELEHDEIKFSNRSYETIYAAYLKSRTSGQIPDMNFFITHSDVDVTKVAIDLVSSPYTLAKWEQHNIAVQTESQILKKSVYDSIYSFKARQIEQLLDQNSNILKTADRSENLDALIQKQQDLIEAKKYFNKLLGRIVVK